MKLGCKVMNDEEMNIKTFDIVLTPPFGLASLLTQSITIHRSRIYKRKQKIKRIFNEG